jgi:hypothetical protein
MYAALTRIFLLMCNAPSNAWEKTGAKVMYGEASSRQNAASNRTGSPATSGSKAGTHPKSALRVFLTRRKSWLVSGGFTGALSERGKEHVPAPDFAKDFHKRCPSAEIRDMQNTADYAVTIEEIGLLDSLSGSDAPTFQVAVYSRSAGLFYTGGTRFLKNAVKDACNAIGAK